MKSLQICFGGFVVLLLLAGCGSIPGLPINSPGSIATAATAVVTTKPTNTQRPTITPVPAPSRRATFSILPSLTHVPTMMGLPSFTPYITQVVPTLPPYDIGFGAYTSTQEPLKCTVDSTYPEWGQVFKPRTDFIAKWQVYNSGKNMWRVDDILFGYVSGEKMHRRDREDIFIANVVFVHDKINLQVHLVSPKEAGIYTTVWGLRRSNKKDFFCTFPISIKVVQ